MNEDFCFQPETDPKKFPSRGDNLPFISIPKALSIDSDASLTCSILRDVDPDEYDMGAEGYCETIWENHKDTEGFDFRTTGCQCFIDSKINIDDNLERLITEFETFPHCIWKSCRESGDQLVPVRDNTENKCPRLPDCANIVINLGEENILDNVKFEQNVQCNRGGEKNECNSNDQCGTGSCNSYGLCVGSCDENSCDPGFFCNPDTKTCDPHPSKKKISDTTRGIIMLIIVGAIVLVSIIGISIYYFKWTSTK